MNKELEEAVSLLKEMQDNALIACRCYKTDGVLYRDKKAEEKVNAIEIVLNYIENSIPKQELRKDLKILQETKVDDKEKNWMKSGIEEYLKKILEGK